MRTARGPGGPRSSRLTALLLALGCAAVAPGCMHVTVGTTAYYKHGPSQPGPPDGDLPEGTRVWVVGRDGSYVRVWTLTGVDAYVWDRCLRPAWEPRKPATSPAVQPTVQTRELEPPAGRDAPGDAPNTK